jgi:hypothetical protein
LRLAEWRRCCTRAHPGSRSRRLRAGLDGASFRFTAVPAAGGRHRARFAKTYVSMSALSSHSRPSSFSSTSHASSSPNSRAWARTNDYFSAESSAIELSAGRALTFARLGLIERERRLKP